MSPKLTIEMRILYICAERLSGNLTGGKIENIGDILELSKHSRVDVITPYDIENLPDIFSKNPNIHVYKHHNITKNPFNFFSKNSSNIYKTKIDYSIYDTIILSCFRTFYHLYNYKINRRKKLIIKSHGSILKWNISNFKMQRNISLRYVIKKISKIIIYSVVETIVPIYVNEIWYMTSQEDNLIAKILKKPKKINKLGSSVYFEEISRTITKDISMNNSNSCFIIGDWNIPHNTSALIEFFKSPHINKFKKIIIVGNMNNITKQSLNINKIKNVIMLGYLKDIRQFQAGSYTWVVCADGGSGVPIKLIEACEFADKIICTSYCYSLMQLENLNKKNIPVEVF